MSSSSWSHRRLPTICAILLTSSVCRSYGATAAELVVYGAADCEVSRRFEGEAAPVYQESPANRVFHLRRVDITNGLAEVTLSEPVSSTPTFVFVDQGQEIARFVGYPGKEQFYRLVEGAAEAFAASKDEKR